MRPKPEKFRMFVQEAIKAALRIVALSQRAWKPGDALARMLFVGSTSLQA
jgi:hypothetical protein